MQPVCVESKPIYGKIKLRFLGVDGAPDAHTILTPPTHTHMYASPTYASKLSDAPKVSESVDTHFFTEHTHVYVFIKSVDTSDT